MANKTNMSLENVLDDINAKIQHVEDIEADTRKLLIQLVKQGNQIVKFLSNIEIEDITSDFENVMYSPLSESEKIKADKMQEVKGLLDEFKDKHKDLKEFEEELEKNKDKLTPGHTHKKNRFPTLKSPG